MARAAHFRHAGAFYAWGHYWHDDVGTGRARGNVSGAMYHDFLQPGQVEQDCPGYCEPVHGIPWAVGEMIDAFFSGLSLHENKDIHHQWAETVYSAITPGADLSLVPDKMAAYILETPDWLAAYAGEAVGHQVGMFHSITVLRLNGIDQEKRIKDFYYDHLYKLHRHQTDATRSLENAARDALKGLCGHMMERRRGPLGYFLQHAVGGSAVHKRQHAAKRWVELSQIFIHMIEDAR